MPAIFAERTGRTRSNVLRQLEKLVAWGIERRGGPRDLDSELFARLLMEMAEDSARLILTQPNKFTIDRIVTFATTLMGAVPGTPRPARSRRRSSVTARSDTTVTSEVTVVYVTGT